MGKNSFLFVGVDLVKNKKILEKAYNDSKGISAKFNLNLIKRINRELQTNLNQKNFKYTSQFNKQNSSVGCYLICKKKIEFTIGGKKISIKVNEKIQTEISKKFTLRSFENLSNSAGWTVKKNWLDKKNNYAILLLESKK